MSALLTANIIDRAYALGFDAVGITSADELKEDARALSHWIDEGHHGEMTYMARESHRRSRPSAVLPRAKSVIVLAINYAQDMPSEPESTPDRVLSRGRVSRYAWGRDYHAVIEKRLEELAAFVRDTGGPDADCRTYVDHGPILEKAFARQAGIGFIGKNTLLITEQFGSWVFLSVILTTLELTPGAARTSECGSCRACLDACPTGALFAPYQLDANRCISYMTIESKSEFPDSLKGAMSGWVFGCDICQEVCPYNAHPIPTSVMEFAPEYGAGPWLDLKMTVDITSDDDFRAAFKGTPLLRPKRAGLRRNALALMPQRS